MRTLLFGLLLSLSATTVAISRAAPPPEDAVERGSAARVTKIGDVNAKIFDSWDGALTPGDCKARNAKLTLYENGSLEWEAELISDDGTGEWIQSFDFYDGPSPGHTSLGNRQGRRIDLTLKRTWRSFRWGGPSSPDPKLAEVFGKVQWVRWTAEC